MKAFITGSHAYGTPTDKSDVDLVICVTDDSDYRILLKNFGNARTTNMLPIRVGNLNLIVCDNEEEWAIWKYGTKLLKQRSRETGRPIDKLEATKLFDSMKDKIHIGITGDFSGD